MPLLTIPRPWLDVNVSDRTPGVKQQARWVSMMARQDPRTGLMSVQLQLQVQQSNEAGEPLTGKGIVPYTVPLIADNNSAVNPDTGAVLYMRSTETDEEWLTLLNGKEEPLMLQGDWFLALMSQQIAIIPMLQSFMEQADAPPFSKFS